MIPLQPFIEGAPKVELHVHIEGTLEPKMLRDKARIKNIHLPYNSEEEITAAYNFKDLADFLKLLSPGNESSYDRG